MKDDAPGLPSSGMDPETLAGAPAIERGWYLYGVARPDDRLESALTGMPGLDEGHAVQVIHHGELAAIVSLVSLTELGRFILDDAARLEEIVRSHDRIVERAHRIATILPAKLGCVYASGEDLGGALERSHDAIASQLERLAGYDEWGVRLYADRSLVQQRVAGENPTLLQLQGEAGAVGPGRAYFLKRQIADVLAAATEQALGDLAQAGYDYLAGLASAGQLSPRTDSLQPPAGETEILRAAFLVPRDTATRFLAEIHRFSEDHRELRSEYNGPWAPYSFANLKEPESP